MAEALGLLGGGGGGRGGGGGGGGASGAGVVESGGGGGGAGTEVDGDGDWMASLSMGERLRDITCLRLKQAVELVRFGREDWVL